MARITICVESRHADNRLCEHAVKPSGKPRSRDRMPRPAHSSPSSAPNTATSARAADGTAFSPGGPHAGHRQHRTTVGRAQRKIRQSPNGLGGN
jgi:hypothetical protein